MNQKLTALLQAIAEDGGRYAGDARAILDAGRTKPRKGSAGSGLHPDMTDAQRFAYFKRIAPLEDARFALRYGIRLSPDLERDWAELVIAIQAGLPVAESRRRLQRLHERWRIERQDAERAAGIPAIGSTVPEIPDTDAAEDVA